MKPREKEKMDKRVVYIVIVLIAFLILITLITPTGYIVLKNRCDMGYNCIEDFKLVYQYGNCEIVDVKICMEGCYEGGCIEP